MKKIILLIFIFNLVSHCGFTPLYSNYSEVNFSIVSIKTEGDTVINNYIKSNLTRFDNDKPGNQFTIKVDTNYKKKTLSKNKTAEITNFELITDVIIEIFLNGTVIKELIISERETMDANDDDFEELKNERIIKQNFASSITDKLTTELSILNAD